MGCLSNCSQSQCPTNRYETPGVAKIGGENEPLLTCLRGRQPSLGFGRLPPIPSRLSAQPLAQQRPGQWLGALGALGAFTK